MAGLYYEELEPGLVIDHPTRKTVTETDNVLFCSTTLNLAPLHLDAEYAKESIYGERLVNSLYILGLVTGITVPDSTQGTTLGNLGFENVTFPKPVFHGDTIRVRTEVIERRTSKSRPEAGIVQFLHQGINQRDEIVCECKRAGYMIKKDAQSGE